MTTVLFETIAKTISIGYEILEETIKQKEDYD